MKENTYYDYLKGQLRDRFRPVKILKEEEDLRISLMFHPESGQLFVLREFCGSPEVYRKLMTVASPHLPRIYDVAEKDGKLLVADLGADEIMKYTRLSRPARLEESGMIREEPVLKIQYPRYKPYLDTLEEQEDRS